MINVMENKVLGPIIQQQFELGRSEGAKNLLQALLTRKFGPLPAWASEKLHAAAYEEWIAWGMRALHTTTLEKTLR